MLMACSYTENEGPGHIRVYTVTGELQTIIMCDNSQEKVNNRPLRLLVSFFNEIYMIVLNKGLLKIKDNIVCQTNYESDIDIDSIAVDQYDHVFAASIDENVVQQLQADGTLLGTVLTEDDGLNQPQAIAFDCKKNVLYVAMKEASQIQMYSLDYM